MKQLHDPGYFFADLYYFRGRVALFALLKGMGIGKGDEVALQAFTCVANPEAIMAAGATPVYVDVESDGVNMDPSDLEQKITSRTRAIIIQHTFGIPADLDSLLAVAQENNLPVIEDCCHTLTSQYNGKSVGTFGIGSYYSFEWGKPIVAGIGGALLVNDQVLEKKVKEQYTGYQNPPAGLDVRIRVQYMAHNILYRPRLYWPLRSLFHTLGRIGAAESNYNPVSAGHVGGDFSLKMLRFARFTLEKKISQRQSVSKHSLAVTGEYLRRIHSSFVKHIVPPDKSFSVYCRYPLFAKNKNVLLKKARKANVEMAGWYSTPIHPLIGKELGQVHYLEGDCPNAEKRCTQIVTLPVNLHVRPNYIDRTLQFINDVS